jgi:hypothetical protein
MAQYHGWEHHQFIKREENEPPAYDEKQLLLCVSVHRCLTGSVCGVQEKVSSVGDNRKQSRMHLQGKGDGHANDEEEERHGEVGEVAAVPGGVANDRPLTASAVHQYHQLRPKKRTG